MDEYLLEYLRSGKTWLLVGSGPSVAVGIPTWKELASTALKFCKIEAIGRNFTAIEKAFSQNNFPLVFEEAAALVGLPVLLDRLSTILPANAGNPPKENIYSYIARWPISVYLTTNFDHEISRHLALAGESSFINSANSPDHMNRLLPDSSGLVVHLHGDLRSETGLVLTSSQYQQIFEAQTWEYWRTKMNAVFQMNRVVVLGHSLFDPHIKHVLEAAKKGSGVVQPVCWIAPDVKPDVAREYLEKYRIRVVSYDNRDGTHHNLFRLVQTLSDFVPPRITVHISKAVAQTTSSPLGRNAAAPGFFVFSKLSSQSDFEEKRTDVLVAALHAAVPKLKNVSTFSIQQALEDVGWPSGSPIPSQLAASVGAKAIAEGLLIGNGGRFRVSAEAEERLTAENERFERLRERFQTSLQNRLRRDFPSLKAEHATEIALDIDAALAGFFREGGLTLASTLAVLGQTTNRPPMPSSIIRFVNEASAKYDDHLRRQAFSTVSLDCFIRADTAEREYLGRVSQGFFGFHLLGVFGDAASERLKHVRETVWLVDSSAQLPAIAIGSAAHSAFRDAFQNLSKLGLRFFSTDGLFEETSVHLWFANRIVTTYGPSSPDVISAAEGNVPYRKANLFLEGFINWQAAGNPADWQKYLIAISGLGHTGSDAVRSALQRVGINSTAFPDWPGFLEAHFAEADEAMQKIVEIMDQHSSEVNSMDHEDLLRKAKPEAEALVVIVHERDGEYHMLSQEGQPSSAWFLSQTALLNRVHSGPKITWQPEAFLRFASTLIPIADEEAAERAFGTLLWTIAQSGVTVLDSRVAVTVFGGIIDQARLTISEQHSAYDQVLADKYGTTIDKVLEQVSPLQQPLAALQLANERAERETILRLAAQTAAAEEKQRASHAEAELSKVQKFRNKLQAKQRQAEQRKRKSRSRKNKK